MEDLEGMEKVYLPSSGRCAKPVWCSKKVTFKEYFEKYSAQLKQVQPHSRSSIKDILQNILRGSEMSDIEFKNLTKTMDPKQFFNASLDIPKETKRKYRSPDNDKSVTSAEGIQITSDEDKKTLEKNLPEKNLSKTVEKWKRGSEKHVSNRNINESSNAKRIDTRTNKSNMNGKNNNHSKEVETLSHLLDEAGLLNQPSTSWGGGQPVLSGTKPKTKKLGKAETSNFTKAINVGDRKKQTKIKSGKNIDEGSISVTIDDSLLAIATFHSTQSDSSDDSLDIDDEIADKDYSFPQNALKPSTQIHANADNNISIPSTDAADNSNLNDPNPLGLRRSARNKNKIKVGQQEAFKKKSEMQNNNPQLLLSDKNDFEELYEQRSASEIVHEVTQKASSHNRKTISVKGSILVDTTQRLGNKDLEPRKNFVVSFRIHKPYKHGIGQRGLRPGKCLQEIDVLNYQTLADLREKIMCEADFQDTAGDVSNWPYSPITTLAKEKYKSGMFYLDNTFYIDTQEGAEDYSVVIRKWAKEHFINVGETKPMDEMKVEDLRVRLGYPYVYMHQGSCEHIIIVSQARFVTEKHSLHSSDYPNITKTSRSPITYCGICVKKPAKWIVMGSDRMLQDINFMCQECYQSYHYIGTEKIGKFKSYRWKQRALLYH